MCGSLSMRYDCSSLTFALRVSLVLVSSRTYTQSAGPWVIVVSDGFAFAYEDVREMVMRGVVAYRVFIVFSRRKHYAKCGRIDHSRFILSINIIRQGVV